MPWQWPAWMPQVQFGVQPQMQIPTQLPMIPQQLQQPQPPKSEAKAKQDLWGLQTNSSSSSTDTEPTSFDASIRFDSLKLILDFDRLHMAFRPESMSKSSTTFNMAVETKVLRFLNPFLTSGSLFWQKIVLNQANCTVSSFSSHFREK